MILFLMIVHVIICILLIGIILIQAGRGGGLVEGFSGVESMFGTKTNSFLTRSTTILSSLFFVTCVSLALLSARQGRSLMRNVKPEKIQEQAVPQEQTAPKASETQAPTTPQSPPQTAPVAEKQEAPKTE